MNKKIAVLFFFLSLFIFPTAAFAHGDGEHITGVAYNYPVQTLLAAVVAGGAVAALLYFFAKEKNLWKFAAAGLMTGTGIIHVAFGVAGEWLLLLNGIGYLALMIDLFMPIKLVKKFYRPLLGVAFGYTVITFVGYFVMHDFDHMSDLGLATKAIEALLLVTLVVLLRSRPALVRKNAFS